MNGVSGNEVWWKDSMVILGLSLPMSLWLFMSIFLFIAICGITILQEGIRVIPLISSKQLSQNEKNSYKFIDFYSNL